MTRNLLLTELKLDVNCNLSNILSRLWRRVCGILQFSLQILLWNMEEQRQDPTTACRQWFIAAWITYLQSFLTSTVGILSLKTLLILSVWYAFSFASIFLSKFILDSESVDLMLFCKSNIKYVYWYTRSIVCSFTLVDSVTLIPALAHSYINWFVRWLTYWWLTDIAQE